MLKPLNKLLKVLVLLVLLWVILGLTLSPSYQAKHSITISRPLEQVAPLLIDLSRWPSWLAIAQFESGAEIVVPAKSQGVGANIYWSGESSKGELSIINMTESELFFQVLINSEYLSTGSIEIQSTAQGTVVTWSQNGDVSIPVFGPYLAWLAQHQLQNTIIHSLNNLKTDAELPEPVLQSSED